VILWTASNVGMELVLTLNHKIFLAEGWIYGPRLFWGHVPLRCCVIHTTRLVTICQHSPTQRLYFTLVVQHFAI